MWIDIQAGPWVMVSLWAAWAILLGIVTYGLGRAIEAPGKVQ